MQAKKKLLAKVTIEYHGKIISYKEIVIMEIKKCQFLSIVINKILFCFIFSKISSEFIEKEIHSIK